ncbi:NAD-binding protein [Nodosilinea sp. LEGE 06152]|uniref:potassium channel family protein n=1 Tax=Nodosilinea sp. LEGE 06152 TaxID=2777966 RepID=UPI00187FADAC|nr:NAD-binding protein [Nodosilinea sp. LEGE 06152]MBE9158154.1 NAD-binding protein [Nodosilinea sp. LEGE 06152]
MVSAAPPPEKRAIPPANDGFLVCGLGSLGQNCVANLKSFGVPVHAINNVPPDQWEMPQLRDLIDHLEIGDCRSAAVLEQAGIRQCRAVLLVTQDERVNLEAALTARVLNPRVRLVMRSDKQNLNELMGQQLQDFVAFEPTQLAAPAFALGAFGEELIGYFSLDGHRFQVVKQRLESGQPWCDRRQIHELDNSRRRVLCHTAAEPDPEAVAESPSTLFYTWLPDTLLRAGDEVVMVDCNTELRALYSDVPVRPGAWKGIGQAIARLRDWPTLKQSLLSLWQTGAEQQLRRVAIICGVTVVALCLVGTLLFDSNAAADISTFQAFLYTFITLFGGYGDVFEALEDFNHPRLVQAFGVLLTVAGAAFVGVLYALLTEKLLTLRFEFRERRPPVPEKDHVVVIWLGRVGRQVLAMLQELEQPVVGIAPQAPDADVLPKIPLLTGDVTAALAKANLTTAKSVIAVSEDEIQNLEMGLLAHRLNPHCRAIIRTYDQQFTDRVAQIFPFAQVLCSSALSAEAFAGAAFGEHVIGLFRLYDQTVLVTQYELETGDSLTGRLLSEVAYGYGVVPLWHQHQGQPGKIMPSEDARLQPGDRLVVLATIGGLRRIEQCHLAPQDWHVHLEKTFTANALFDGAAEVARVAGYPLGAAREFMAQLPGLLPVPLYRHQALRLVRLLIRAQVKARAIAPQVTGSPLTDRPTSESTESHSSPLG